MICGNSDRHDDGEPAAHGSVDAVRACHQADEIWACDWLVACTHPEDGETTTAPCAAMAWHLPDGRGYTCENGHSHVYCDVRHREGWDYAADPDEAGLLAGRGVRPVAMDGSPIDINPHAMRYVMTLPG